MSGRVSSLVTVSLVAVLAGFALGRLTASDSAEPPHDPASAREEARALTESRDALQAKLDKLQRDLVAVARVDLDEYLRLQDAEERARKLGDLLGQVFIVLMNNALVPTTPERTTALEALSGGRTSGSGAARDDGPGDGGEAETDASSAGASPPANEPRAVAPESAWSQVEAELPQLTLANADAFLAKAAIPDLRSEIKDGRAFSADDPRVAQLQGLFTGDVRFLNAKSDPLTIEMETTATEVEGGQLKGTYSVRTFKNGDRTGNSTSSGNLDGIMNTTGTSAALIVQFSPDRFMQLYYVNAADAYVGNVYEMSNAKDSKLVGRVKLTR